MSNCLRYTLLAIALSVGYSSVAKDTLLTVIRPRIGGGIGTMAYYGEIQNYQKGFLPLVNRYGGMIYCNAPVTKFFNLEFSASFAKVAANERTLTTNMNFQSRIRMGSVSLYYNFYPMIKPYKGHFHPFIGVGLGSFEFLAKTDLYDGSGNLYHYWSDGSIRNMDEADPMAATAKYLSRDYTYETDLRALDLDGLGKYREQSFTFPLSAGVEWHITPRWDFRVAFSYCPTLTDLIDNMSPAGTGTRQGDKNKDRLLWSYCSMSYDLQVPKFKRDSTKGDDDIPLFAEWDQVDWDKDGIIDALDNCPGTPIEAIVDGEGCPQDGDADGVPDFLDEELDTPTGNMVNQFGVTLTAEDIAKHWALYNDSTGYLHDFTELRTVVNPAQDKITSGKLPRLVSGRNYVVIIGKEQKDITANELHKYLGYQDFKTITVGDTTYYVIGEYKDLQDAVAAAEGLENAGVKVEVIGKNNYESGNMTPVDQASIDKVSKINKDENYNVPTFGGTDQLFRVQLGAFSKKVDLNTSFRDIEDINFAMGSDGLYHYYTGSFKTYEEAEAHRKFVAYKKGHKSAFVVAYKGEDRVLLRDVVPVDSLPSNYNPNKELTTFVEPYIDPKNQDLKIDMTKVKYHLKLGYYPGDVPKDDYDALMAVKEQTGRNLVPLKGTDGSMTFYTTEFKSEGERNEAIEVYKQFDVKMIEKIIKYDGKYYTTEEWSVYLDSLK